MQSKVKKNIDPLSIQKISQQGRIAQIVGKVKLLESLNLTLFQILSPNLKPHCEILNIEGFTLVIGCHSNHIANLLYYQQNSLLTQFKEQHPTLNVNQIRVKISATTSAS